MKVVGYAGGYYKELLRWNPLDLDIKEEWRNLDRDWPKQCTKEKYSDGNMSNNNPDLNLYIGDWRRIGELGENYIYALGRLVSCPQPYDRTEKWNLFNVLTNPIPPLEGINHKFEDVVFMMAEELWKRNRPIRLWWSGGIDSTTALCALLSTKPIGAELIILMSEATKVENPSMSQSILNDGFDVKIEWSTKENMWNEQRWWTDGSLNITGECGDPMYGTFVVEHHIEEIDEPWKKIFEWDDVDFLYSKPEMRLSKSMPILSEEDNAYHKEKCIEFCEEFIKDCPFEVRTTFDFTWWLAFTIKWQWIDRRLFQYLENPSNWRNMESFFNTPEFQKWSMWNHDLKHKGTWKTYKWPSKEFIYKFNRDATYRDNKTKEKSIPYTAPVGLEAIKTKLIMEDGTYVKYSYPSVSYHKLNKPIPVDIDKWDVLCKPTFDKIKEKTNVRIPM